MIAEKSKTRNYDLFKGAVALALVIIIVLLLLQGRGGSLAEREPTAEAPTFEAPTVALPAAEVATTEPPTAVVPTIEPTPAPTMVPTVKPTALDWALPSLNVPQLAADGTLSLSGTGEPGTTVELWAGEVKLGSVPVGADGTWSWEGKLDPGDYALTARTVDAAGQALNESAALTLNVPQLEVEIALPEINPPELTDGTLSLSGMGEPGATVELWAGEVKLGSVPVGADGTWSWTGELDPGDYALTARTVDAAGKVLNESASQSLNVPQPEVEMALPEINTPELTDGTLSLSGRGEPGATVELWAGDVKLGSVPVGADGAWSWEGELDPGDYALMARTVDAAGQVLNESASLALTVEVPTPAPGTAETVGPEASGEGEGYVVQPGDSLSALAARFYGNGQLWRLIYDATNAKAAEDPTFQAIDNPNFIRPGWKLWIPAQ